MDVFYSPKLPRNIISFLRLENKGCELRYVDGKRVVARKSDGVVIFEVHQESNVLVVRLSGTEPGLARGMNDTVFSALSAAEEETRPGIQKRSLMHFHARFGALGATAAGVALAAVVSPDMSASSGADVAVGASASSAAT